MPATPPRRDAAHSTMTLHPILTQEQLDRLDPLIRAEYREDGEGRFVLDVAATDGFELTNTRGLLNSLSAARGERDEAQREIREMRSRLGDADLDELKEAQARLRELTENGQGGGADADTLRREIEAQIRADFERKQSTLSESFQQEIETREQRIERLTGQLRKRVFTDEARDAILAVDKGAEPLFLLPEIERRTRVVETDEGDLRVEVLNAEGQVDYVSRDGQAVPKTLKDVVADLKADARFGRAFSGGVASGSGAAPAVSGGKPEVGDANPWDRNSDAFSLTEQARIMKADPERAKRLQAQAPKPRRQSMLPMQESGGRGTATTIGRHPGE